MRIGYVVPQFPSQTHIMFWRELEQLAAIGVEAEAVTTRTPDVALRAHRWSEEALARTVSLFPVGPRDALLALDRALRAGPRSWARVAGAVLDERGRGRVEVLAAAVLGARLAAHARRRCWSHLHVHSCASAADVAAFARILGGPPYSLTLHGPISDYGGRQRQKWSGASFGIAITEHLRTELVTAVGAGAVPARVEVVGMGGDLTGFARPEPYVPWDPNSGPARVFSCGRLNPAKGHGDLICAVSLLRARGLEVELTIAGEDEHGGTGFRQQLEHLAEEQGVADAVQLLGAVDEGRVVDELHAAHVFVLASRAEPLGVAVMEAMAASIPTVATAAGGIPELVADGESGLLVPPGVPAALADALARVLSDPSLALALSAGAGASAARRAQLPTSADVLASLIRSRR